MKKTVALLLCVACLCGLAGCKGLLATQYNEHGVSHFLVITLDKDQPKEYIGELESYQVFIEGLDPENTYFTSTDANQRIFIGEALDNGLVSLDEWRAYAWKTVTDGDVEILQFENYEIVIASGECVIRPLTERTKSK